MRKCLTNKVEYHSQTVIRNVIQWNEPTKFRYHDVLSNKNSSNFLPSTVIFHLLLIFYRWIYSELKWVNVKVRINENLKRKNKKITTNLFEKFETAPFQVQIIDGNSIDIWWITNYQAWNEQQGKRIFIHWEFSLLFESFLMIIKIIDDNCVSEN